MTLLAPSTWFASPERATALQLEIEHRSLLANPTIVALLDRMPDPIVILNRQRQIVLANRCMTDLLKRTSDELIGLRPGEAIGCVHAGEGPNGCGTSLFCRVCGAIGAILNSQSSEETSIRDCRIRQLDTAGLTALDLRVWSSPLHVDNADYTLVSMRDVSDEKRRRLLERTFFHDLINTVVSLQSTLTLWMADNKGPEAEELARKARVLADQALDEIASQRDLLAAERGELAVRREAIDVFALLTKLSSLYGHLAVAQGKRIRMPRLSETYRIASDPALLNRVLGNLLKNALEASSLGQTVTLDYRHEPWPTFTVHNEAVMPEDVRLQIFHRSFSTKAETGRGIGSYSVKLLTERYLGGRVTFDSRPGFGTVFTIELNSMALDVADLHP